MKVRELRKHFLNFFANNDHAVWPSSSLLPKNDPSLLFTNSGMVQFKDFFLGKKDLPVPPRITTAQKCLRAGGKHNDLENVGFTSRHHTFFEMLGNFSFGDYFKEQAIYYAWNLVHKELNLPIEKLWVTVFIDDDEAVKLWQKIAGLPEEKIIRIAGRDNFWSMGEHGPCGPCSEIFFDHGDKIPGGLPGTPEADGDRFVEIYNLVFMEFNILETGEVLRLPLPSVDTGMGLERMAAVLQGVHSNYEIDLFKMIIEAAKDFSGKSLAVYKNAHQIIADHLRAIAFLIADGVLPSNEGVGYVLRRILRRALRQTHKLDSPGLLTKLVPVLIKEMGEDYNELKINQAAIESNIALEEEKFAATLERGLKVFSDLIGNNFEADNVREEAALFNKEISGEMAFKLYDTYGFPFDLTVSLAKEHNLTVNEDSFQNCLARSREQNRFVKHGAEDRVGLNLQESQFLETKFLGYDALECSAEVLAIFENGQSKNWAKVGDSIQLILDQTVFYPEGGGQIGDNGFIYQQNNKIKILDTQKIANLVIHYGLVEQGEFAVNSKVTLAVDEIRRQAIRTNHSATHLLNLFLTKILGNHVMQRGSKVTDQGFRFDFSHPSPLTKEQIWLLEEMVNEAILKNASSKTLELTKEEAFAMGAKSLAGEDYKTKVRVVDLPVNDTIHSLEFCGGTHVKCLGEIALFKIVSESGVSSGVRRIEAVTREKALEFVEQRLRVLAELEDFLQVSFDGIMAKIQKPSKKCVVSKKQEQLLVREGFRLFWIETNDLMELQKEVDLLRKDPKTIICGFDPASLGFICALGTESVRNWNAVSFVKQVNLWLGGQGVGGGRADFARGGGKNKIPVVELKKLVQEYFF